MMFQSRRKVKREKPKRIVDSVVKSCFGGITFMSATVKITTHITRIDSIILTLTFHFSFQSLIPIFCCNSNEISGSIAEP
ncbi:hypothetical protein VNO78_18107 [Psophocarpus tetragonolobus]|uniref:Uncharacterized protein n=1 Tax=Psophocarpus tetragonolobus TaxID=3891 RepID=A0AAN9XLP8_PSOTE